MFAQRAQEHRHKAVSYTHLIGYIYPCVAQDKPIRTEESLEGTVIYKTTTTFEVDGYTYQCDVDAGSQFVTLYNKENKLTYEKIVYKDTGKIYIGSWSSNVIEYDRFMSQQADFIVDQAFTKAMEMCIRDRQLLHLHYPEALGSGVPGLLKSLVFSLVIVGLTGLLVKGKIKLKV